MTVDPGAEDLAPVIPPNLPEDPALLEIAAFDALEASELELEPPE